MFLKKNEKRTNQVKISRHMNCLILYNRIPLMSSNNFCVKQPVYSSNSFVVYINICMSKTFEKKTNHVKFSRHMNRDKDPTIRSYQPSF